LAEFLQANLSENHLYLLEELVEKIALIHDDLLEKCCLNLVFGMRVLSDNLLHGHEEAGLGGGTIFVPLSRVQELLVRLIDRVDDISENGFL